jgi:hypothetical protein
MAIIIARHAPSPSTPCAMGATLRALGVDSSTRPSKGWLPCDRRRDEARDNSSRAGKRFEQRVEHCLSALERPVAGDGERVKPRNIGSRSALNEPRVLDWAHRSPFYCIWLAASALTTYGSQTPVAGISKRAETLSWLNCRKERRWRSRELDNPGPITEAYVLFSGL